MPSPSPARRGPLPSLGSLPTWRQMFLGKVRGHDSASSLALNLEMTQEKGAEGDGPLPHPRQKSDMISFKVGALLTQLLGCVSRNPMFNSYAFGGDIYGASRTPEITMSMQSMGD